MQHYLRDGRIRHYQPNAQQSRQNQQRRGIAQFLLGQGPLPPPRPEELAVAYALAGLNAPEGFGGPLAQRPEPVQQQPLEGPLDYVAPPAQQAPAAAAGHGAHYRPAAGPEEITVLAPINTTKEGEPVIQATFKLSSTLSPVDFLHNIRRFMGIEGDGHARLGYRIQPANRSEAFLRFETVEDVQNAVSATLTRMKRAISRVVQLEVTNLDYRPDAARPAAGGGGGNAGQRNPPQKSTDIAYSEELRIVREKLACAHCSIIKGGQAWCYVDRTVSEHVPLQPEHLTLWARCMHDGLCDRDCRNPPNCLALDKLRGDAKRATRMAEQRRKKGNGVGLPEIHVHVGSPLHGRSPNRHRSSRHKRRSRRKHSSSPPPTSDLSSSSSESMASSDHEEDEALPISDVLSVLNATQPAACYPSFEGALVAKGIIYAHSALYFDAGWYVREVHMPEGLVRPFLHQVKVMLKKRRRSGEMGRAEKRMRTDENIDPTLR
ncbi:hypothetical protein BV20DRAFT_1050023 [Pilatotrama ljubarskyi]|nr:hypothetical protein BV20DRAFT_1050023 [Pilatotrama ljubarskyi]